MRNWFLGQGIPMYAETILLVAGIVHLMDDRKNLQKIDT